MVLFKLTQLTPRKREAKWSIALHATLLRGTAAVVRQRRHVFDSEDLQTGILDLKHRLLTTGAGAFYFDLDFNHAMLACFAGRFFSCATGGERGALAGTLEANSASRRPGDRLTIGVGDGDHRVVEGRLHMGHATRDALAKLLLRS